MELGLVVGIVLLVLVLLIAAGVMTYAYLKQRIDWLPLPGHPGVGWRGTPTTDVVLLRAAYEAAVSAILTHSTVPTEAVRKGVSPISIYVMNDNKWVDEWGRSIAGTSNYGIVTVGFDLSALCHELCHAVEQVWLLDADRSHETWTAKGFWKADEAYRVKLAELYADRQ